MQAALYGKHPAWGDFVQAGLPPQVLRGLEAWLDGCLSEARDDLGARWEAVWDAAPILRFWIGEGIFGAVLCGVMAASQDRVGRRFPLLMLAAGPAGAAPMPPVIDPSQGWHAGAEAHLRQVLRLANTGPVEALVSGFALPGANGGGVQAGAPDFWAMLPGAGLGTLLADVALTDHRRAVAGRSYWWVAGMDAALARADRLSLVEGGVPLQDEVSVEDRMPGHVDGDVAPGEGLVGGAPTALVAMTAGNAADSPRPAEVERVVSELVHFERMDAASDPNPSLPDPFRLDALPPDAKTAAASDPAFPHAGDDEAASPFATSGAGSGLFAPPMPSVLSGGPSTLSPAQPDDHLPALAASRPSRIHAGAGLPSGTVLAWLLRV